MKEDIKSLEPNKAKAWNSKFGACSKELKKMNDFVSSHRRDFESQDDHASNTVIEYGKKVQTETFESLAKTKEMLAETHEIADTTITSLALQTEKIKRMKSDLDDISDTVERSREITMRMIKETAG
eukprot:350231_1